MNRTLCTIALLSSLFAPVAAQCAPETEYNLGVRAYIAKDFGAARKHWARAVAEDETSAFNNLGFLYYMGLGGQPDARRAVSLWRTAAMRGHAEAQHHLGGAYEAGKGVASDFVQAYAWYRASVTNTPPPEDKEERDFLNRTHGKVQKLLGMIPVGQLGDAEQLARDYIARYPAGRSSR